jgi:ComF family protein
MVVDSFLKGLFPLHCVLCGLRSHRELPLCEVCEAELTPNRTCCQRCALPLPPAGPAPRLCGICQQQAPRFDRVVAPWLYSDHLAHLIHRWKYQGDIRLTRLLAHLWLQEAKYVGSVDLLIPVPLHWRKHWRRGFNQSELLASRLYRDRPELCTGGLDLSLVRRTRATPAQSGMDARQRHRNLRGAFTTHRSCASLRVALVDDVLTTGATADALAGALRAAGVSRIEVWCLARTPSPGG